MPDYPASYPSFRLPPPFSIRFGSRLLDLSHPKVMGILNVTTDSFFAESRTPVAEQAIRKAEQMLSDGADVLDVGGYSTRPGAIEISVSEEIDRVAPVIEKIRSHFPEVILSVDTFRGAVAVAALNAGTNLINDISGGLADVGMWPLVAKRKVPYILMHIRKGVNDMHQLFDYEDIALEVTKELNNRISEARKSGITDIVADPGFGFSKTGQQNFDLLKHLDILQILDVPLLAGISRKSMVYKTLKIKPEDALPGTAALNMAALTKGASILRVHDVKEAVQTVRLFEKLCLPEL